MSWGLSRFSRSENGTVPLRNAEVIVRLVLLTPALRIKAGRPTGARIRGRKRLTRPLTATKRGARLHRAGHVENVPHKMRARGARTTQPKTPKLFH